MIPSLQEGEPRDGKLLRHVGSGHEKFVLRWAPCVRDVPDMGSSWKSFTVLLNLQPHRINADRGGRTGFDREAPIYRKEGKISVDMMGEAVTR